MAQRYIYLNDELNNRLKLESNASGLIVQLLNEYYKTNKPLDISNIKREIETIELDLNKKRELIESSKLRQIETLSDEEARTKAKAKRDAESERLRNSILEEIERQEQEEIHNNLIIDDILD
jgi:hypothetical protein